MEDLDSWSVWRMIVLKTPRACSGNVANPSERSMNDISWNKLSFAAVVGYSGRLFEAYFRD